ncbi:MAG: hypothetical protein KGO81_01025 [Bacteroidota bacterium]|nr:hypothetical protein [Bacteroidota bacterium]
MKINTLFEAYEILITNKVGSKKIFENSGMVDVNKKLDFGFFPLGSGILLETKSLINKASIDDDCVMVLGNDFGTITYFEKKCKHNRENSSKTIANLMSLGLDLENTFFTNFYLGLRNDKIYQGTTMTKKVKKMEKDYKDLCYNFFQIQLELINPKIVICLGAEVGQTLSEFSDVFSNFSSKNKISNLYADYTKQDYIIYTNDCTFEKRKFVLIPHPSYAHINWKKNDIENQIKKAIQN